MSPSLIVGALLGQMKLVRPQAEKTQAYQLNNHLLLSKEASAYTKPHLEIFVDDVAASHGATISQIKEEELFYLRSRGLSLIEAKHGMLEIAGMLLPDSSQGTGLGLSGSLSQWFNFVKV